MSHRSSSFWVVYLAVVVQLAVGCARLDDDLTGAKPSLPSDAERQARFLARQNVRCIDHLESFSGTELSGFSAEKAFGPPLGAGEYSGSTDVFVLGKNQSAVFAAQGYRIVDGDGPDFKVFENSFRVTGSEAYFLEYATVEISDDLEVWYGFRHQAYSGAADSPEGKVGLVGINPVWINYKSAADLPIRETAAGGDAFDLSHARRILSYGADGHPDSWQLDENEGIAAARYIRITDQFDHFPPSNLSLGNGVDIDAVCLVNFSEVP